MAEIIKDDDADALCTRVGWSRWLEARKKFKRTGDVAAVANARFWITATKTESGKKDRVLFLECERHNDAVVVATLLFGGRTVDVARLPVEMMPQLPSPRVQVRWVGMAARRVPDLRMQTRRIASTGQPGRWTELR